MLSDSKNKLSPQKENLLPLTKEQIAFAKVLGRALAYRWWAQQRECPPDNLPLPTLSKGKLND
jgi:hypothetical protein